MSSKDHIQNRLYNDDNRDSSAIVMGVKSLPGSIDRLIEHWQKQSIDIISKSIKEIGVIQREHQFSLPQDFIALYARVNGMQTYYPNEIDNEGFLFYPVEAIVSAQKEFETSQSSLTEKKDLYIFAEYMHKSWWYAVDIDYEHNSYEIGIIPEQSPHLQSMRTLTIRWFTSALQCPIWKALRYCSLSSAFRSKNFG